MTAPSIASITTLEDASNTTSRNLTKPSGTADGDWLLYIGCIDGITTGSFTMSGFTQVYLFPGASSFMAVYVKLAASEGASYTVGTASEAGNHWLARITGSSATTAAEFVNALSGFSADDGTYSVALRAYASTTDCLVLRACGVDASTARVITDPGGHTSSYNDTASGTAATSLSVCYTTTTSPTDVASAAFTLDGVEQNQALTIVISSTATESYPAQPVIKCVEYVTPNTTGAITYPKPWGTADNDILFMQNGADTTGILTAPASQSPAFTSIDDTSNTAIWGHACWRKAASEGASYTASSASTAVKMGMIARIVGADATTPINQHTVATGTTATPTASTLTPSVDNCLLWTGFVADDDDITNGAGFTATWTETLAMEIPSGADMSYLAQSKNQTTAAATGSVAMTLDLSEEWIAFNVAFKPAAVAAAPVAGPFQVLESGFIVNYGGQGFIDPTIQKLH